MKRAAQLLRDTDLSISEIADHVGFSTRRYFTKVFKETFGILPSQYGGKSRDEKLDEDVYKEEFGCIVVIENVFGFKQVLPLQEGDNIIGRRCVGTDINTPIETGDMSMDRRHCIINVKRNRQRELVYTLRDAPSLTGTFLMNEILGDKDRIRIDDGAIITIGATTLILRAAKKEEI